MKKIVLELLSGFAGATTGLAFMFLGIGMVLIFYKDPAYFSILPVLVGLCLFLSGVGLVLQLILGNLK